MTIQEETIKHIPVVSVATVYNVKVVVTFEVWTKSENVNIRKRAIIIEAVFFTVCFHDLAMLSSMFSPRFCQ